LDIANGDARRGGRSVKILNKFVRWSDGQDAPQNVLTSVLDHIGQDPQPASGVTPGLGKLADEVNAAWIARYRAAQSTAWTGKRCFALARDACNDYLDPNSI